MRIIWPTFHYISRSIVTKSSFVSVIVIFILYAVGIRLIHSSVLPRNSLQATFATFQMIGNSFLTLLSMICILLPFLIIFSQTFLRAISGGLHGLGSFKKYCELDCMFAHKYHRFYTRLFSSRLFFSLLCAFISPNKSERI